MISKATSSLTSCIATIIALLIYTLLFIHFIGRVAPRAVAQMFLDRALLLSTHLMF
jgi:hypothetical protein